MSGGGIGAGLGGLAGLALAPETGGLSLAIPAAMGAAGGGIGAALTGGNPLKSALLGGVMGGLGGGLEGGMDATGAFAADGAAPGVGAESLSPALSGDMTAADQAAQNAGAGIGTGVSSGEQATGDGSGLSSWWGDNAPSWAGGNPSDAQMAAAPEGVSQAVSGADLAATPGTLSNAGIVSPATDAEFNAPAAASKGLLSLNTSNPLNDALAATTGLSAIQALLPKKPVNVQANAANVLATNPSFSNPNLPQYAMQNTATPYSGNWYTYGETPQAVQYNAQPTLVPNQAAHAKTGGLVDGYAKGGPVHSYAMGGPLRAPMPPAHQPYIRPMTPQTQPRQYAMGGPVAPMMPPQGAPMGGPAAPMPMQGMPPQRPAMPPQQPQGAVNPLMLKAVHNIGVAIGKHIKAHMPLSGPVHGAGGGHDDLVPAKLSDGEFVHSADVVAALGDGSTKEGGKKLKAFDAAVRAHKTKNGSKFPPKAKNPLKYLPKGSI